MADATGPLASSTHTSPDGLPYLQFSPGAAGDGRLPLIVFLHGTDEHGDSERTLDRLTVHSLPHLAELDELPRVNRAPFGFLVACPQTARPNWGQDGERVSALARHLVREGLADPRRLYVTGISSGGWGSWLAAAAEQRFAALIPISANIPKREAAEVKAPAWVFVGGQDQVVTTPPEQIEADLYRARPDRSLSRFSSVPDGTHSGAFWNRLYGRAELYEWLLKHELAPGELPR